MVRSVAEAYFVCKEAEEQSSSHLNIKEGKRGLFAYQLDRDGTEICSLGWGCGSVEELLPDLHEALPEFSPQHGWRKTKKSQRSPF